MSFTRFFSIAGFLAVHVCVASAFANPGGDEEQAGNWQATFRAEAVNSYETSDQRFVVVSAGNSGSADDAAAAVVSALRQAPSSTVITDDSLGDIEGLNDDEIVAKASELPVDRIAIVRVFPGGEAKPPIAVLTVRDPSGGVDWAVSSARGEAIEPSSDESGGSRGVSNKTTKAVAEATQGRVATQSNRREYLEEFIWFRQWADPKATEDGHIQLDRPYRGRFGVPIAWQDFYREVGRPDLADQYLARRKRENWSITVGSVGLIATVVGGTWWLVQGLNKHATSTTAPMWFTIGSGTAFLGGMAFMPASLHSVPPQKLVKLAHKHNADLKEELGVAPDFSPFPGRSNYSKRLRFRLDLSLEGATGVLHVRF